MSESNARHEVIVDTFIAETMRERDRTERRLELAEACTWNRDEDEIERLRLQLSDAAVAVVRAQDDYAGWSRFFLVPDGHIHSSMGCSTCFPTTQFMWLYELSGLTEAQAVAEYGEILCSVCYPSAPVEWTNGVNKRDAAQRDLHKALLAIERSPEGKAVKRAQELVRSKNYRIEQAERAIERWELDSDHGRDAHGIPAWVAQKAAQAEQDLPKYRKQLAKAEEKLAAAWAALGNALEES